MDDAQVIDLATKKPWEPKEPSVPAAPTGMRTMVSLYLSDALPYVPNGWYLLRVRSGAALSREAVVQEPEVHKWLAAEAASARLRGEELAYHNYSENAEFDSVPPLL